MIAGPEGESGHRAFLEKCAIDAGVAGRVIFAGPMYDDDKTAALIDSDIFALPSRYENFANVVAEAIAFDVPVIISPSCGIQSLVQGRVGLVVSPNVNELASAIRRLIQDKLLYAQLKAGCKAVAAELSWENLTLQMEGCYIEVLGSNSGDH